MAGQILNPNLLLAVPLAPLAGAAIAGLLGTKFLGNVVGRKISTAACILGVLVSLILSVQTLLAVLDGASFNGAIYNWMTIGTLKMEVGFQIDSLSAMMMCVVTFVSLMVHIYTIGYMADDEGYNRFFSYISLFTFSMLMLVMANNFLQLFFGWEAVGLVSYLLIGFWYTRPTAIFAASDTQALGVPGHSDDPRATMFATDHNTLYLLRVVVGITEAGFLPGMLLYLTFWFPAAYRARIIANQLASVIQTFFRVPDPERFV